MNIITPVILAAAGIVPCSGDCEQPPQVAQDAASVSPSVQVNPTPAAICARPIPFFGAAFDTEIDTRSDYNFGIPILFVPENTPAAVAGLVPGDVLLTIDGQKLFFPKQFYALLCTYRPGDKIIVEYTRNGKLFKKEIVLTSRGGVAVSRLPRSYIAPAESEKDDIRLIINGREIMLTQNSAWRDLISVTSDAIIIRTKMGVPEDLRRVVEKVRRRLPSPQHLAANFKMDVQGARAEFFKNVHQAFEQVFFGNGKTVILTGENDSRIVTVRDGDKEVFRGSCATTEEIDAIPEEAREIIAEFTVLRPIKKNQETGDDTP